MGNKTVSIILLVVGIAILVVSLAADPLGIGGGNTAFGPRQIGGTIAGGVVTVVGLVLRLKK